MTYDWDEVDGWKRTGTEVGMGMGTERIRVDEDNRGRA